MYADSFGCPDCERLTTMAYYDGPIATKPQTPHSTVLWACIGPKPKPYRK